MQQWLASDMVAPSFIFYNMKKLLLTITASSISMNCWSQGYDHPDFNGGIQTIQLAGLGGEQTINFTVWMRNTKGWDFGEIKQAAVLLSCRTDPVGTVVRSGWTTITQDIQATGHVRVTGPGSWSNNINKSWAWFNGTIYTGYAQAIYEYRLDATITYSSSCTGGTSFWVGWDQKHPYNDIWTVSPYVGDNEHGSLYRNAYIDKGQGGSGGQNNATVTAASSITLKKGWAKSAKVLQITGTGTGKVNIVYTTTLPPNTIEIYDRNNKTVNSTEQYVIGTETVEHWVKPVHWGVGEQKGEINVTISLV
ncbi:TPA: hypothetical protein R4G84_002873 [Salmonella enterica subsp. enterica serovar Mississippi]|nr:hypothetical protein [Salmonella enterica subsp. enterica]ECW0789061.1 hypothetical protein [Salmonella enterica subsp. enterica]HED0167994.1 hypothetical protein [Salmonella enterica subsp. enterica serovar Mississippi]HED0173858.1 hypothetical protein [Salmonella enterica subsp. enterica serovar Mississippi]HED0195977.1 hypothetical protein [Salmonella enterica subsp. enterica serovar Mississippi]